MNAAKVHARFHLFQHSLSSPTVKEIDHASELILHFVAHEHTHTFSVIGFQLTGGLVKSSFVEFFAFLNVFESISCEEVGLVHRRIQ